MTHFEESYEEKQDGKFKIHQIYTKKPCKTLYCAKCGTNKWYVGVDDYFTAIKCAKCGDKEICVHEG